ncbi:MAG: hypothetical protein EZS28_011370 [Streblomastix strix]|uniref:Rap-GAP domain-containing protein n=1 Tax=Streblomastix strix TaxID=222440 RepID=A0A5J4WEF1_9EUKA|nr:MAG: hypothetical protein EZS28_011370 [Streblomastix strix]
MIVSKIKFRYCSGIEEGGYKQMKVGVLFYDYGQTHETSMFSNKDGSAEFNQFLNFIGCRIQLQGFDGYSGDLDVSDKHLDGRF